jgi:hypothetical protein
MKIKKQLVLFLSILICSLCFEVEKMTEESLLISKYFAKQKKPSATLAIPKDTKTYDFKLIIFRNVNSPENMISREFNVKAVMNKMDLQLIVFKKKGFVESRIWWNDFTLIDADIIFRFDDIPNIKSDYYREVVSEFIPKMSKQINEKSLSFFKQSCAYALKGRYMSSKKTYKDLDGKKFPDQFQLYSFCTPNDPQGSQLAEFIKLFKNLYAHYMTKIIDNLSDLQTFGPRDPKRMKYYTTDFDYVGNHKDNQDFLIGWVRVNRDGVLVTLKKVIIN